VAMSVFWLGEVFTVFSGLGAILVVIAILLVS